MKRKKKAKNREFAIISYIFASLFFILIGYFVYFNTFLAEDVINDSRNTRQDLLADQTIRGDILANNGDILAKTEVYSDDSQKRVYPYGSAFAHVVGYYSETKGRTGVEYLGNFELLTSNEFFLTKALNDLRAEKNVGDSVVTTLNTKLQQTAYSALGSCDGAVVVIEPSTGRILAMVSKPDYNPNEIEESWEYLNGENNNGALFNRATSGLYPPGSTFKIVTALAYMQQFSDYENYSYNCTGSIEVEGETIRCYNGKIHGEQNIRTAFANSCNTCFVDMGLKLDNDKFAKLCEELLFNSDLEVPLSYSESTFSLSKSSSYGETMQTAIGQGDTRVTPLYMAMLASAIANGGELMEPYLIEQIENHSGVVEKEFSSSTYKQLMTSTEAAKLRGYMEEVVYSGTASDLSGQSYAVAGKTGSAEYSDDSSDSHSWFVGYAGGDKADLAISVIVVGGGTGSEAAVPIVKEILNAYYN